MASHSTTRVYHAVHPNQYCSARCDWRDRNSAGSANHVHYRDNPAPKLSGIQFAQYQCFTDDGYGRKLPCSMGYKAANPSWKGTDACHTQSKGKVVPCSAATKAKLSK